MMEQILFQNSLRAYLNQNNWNLCASALYFEQMILDEIIPSYLNTTKRQKLSEPIKDINVQFKFFTLKNLNEHFDSLFQQIQSLEADYSREKIEFIAAFAIQRAEMKEISNKKGFEGIIPRTVF